MSTHCKKSWCHFEKAGALQVLNFGLGGLIIGFIGLAVLLMSLHLYSNWPASVKAMATAAGAMLCAVTYASYPGLLGWPAQEKVLPSRLYLFAIQIEEPHSIYLWGRDLDAGTGNTRPRSYEIPYTVKTHEAGERAGSKLKRGLPIIVERRENQGPRINANEATQIERGELIDFIEAPEGLVPSKE